MGKILYMEFVIRYEYKKVPEINVSTYLENYLWPQGSVYIANNFRILER